MAFIIVSAGQMTDSRMRTIGAFPLLVGAVTVAVVLMASCIAIGYRMAQAVGPGTATQARAASWFDLKRPEGRALLEHVGNLTGRMTRLEIEAAELAKRLGLKPGNAAPVAPAAKLSSTRPSESTHEPSGGPLLPVDEANANVAAAAAAAAPGDYGVGLSHLEAEIARLEVSIEQMTAVAARRELSTMAYPNRLPVMGKLPRISSGFGVRHDPFTGRLARHMGLDIPAASGTPILASGGGRVVSAGFRGPYGNAVVIDHGNGLQTLYGHCSKLFVRAGDLVMPQQKIAAVGSTGRSTGPHLHFEVIRNGTRVAPGRILDTVLARNSN